VTFAPGLKPLGRAYLLGVVVLGFLVIADSLAHLHSAPIGSQWWLLALLTLISGSASVELPKANVSISISEAFVFTAVLLYGPAAGTVTVALDGLVISYWVAKRRPEIHRLLFNIAAPALSAWCSAHIFFAVSGIAPLAQDVVAYDRASFLVDLNDILPGLVLFAITYFGINSWLIAFMIALQKSANPFLVWRTGFVWLSLNYFCGASVAILLVGYNRAIDFRFFLIVVPLLLVLYFTFKTSMDRVKDAVQHVEDLNSLYLSTIETLAMAIDAKDQVTHGHIRRVQAYAVGLARCIGVEDDKQIKAIEAAALLHDMGKLAIPEYILNKPGKLSAAEFAKMKQHASIGADILSAIRFPYPVVPIVRHHHENWDGSGYPAGLKGTDIPVGARILSVVDCYDALTSDRPYRPRLSDDDALTILMERRGSMYDPLIVDTFIRVHNEIAPASQTVPAYDHENALSRAMPARSAPFSELASLDGMSAISDEVATLYGMVGALASQSSLAVTAETVARHIRRLVPHSLLVMFVHNPDHDELEARQASGDAADLVVGIRIPTGQRLSGWVAANRQTIANSDPRLDLGDIARSASPRLTSALSTALVCDGHLVGVLTIYSTRSQGFGNEHRRVLEEAARHVAPLVKCIREADTVDDSSLSAPDRRLLAPLPPFSLTPQSGVCGSLLIVAVTCLTDIRQRYGDRAAALVLTHVASAIRVCVTGAGACFRFDTEHFVILLPDSNLPAAETKARILIEHVAAAPVHLSYDASVRVAVAAHCVASPDDGNSLSELVHAARARTADQKSLDHKRVH
jgi:putative nucleotidyltransferase with HDIG domain